MKLEINFLIYQTAKKENYHLKNGIKKIKILYRGYFPNDVNGKEGLDIGDLKVTKKYSSNLNNQYIEAS